MRARLGIIFILVMVVSLVLGGVVSAQTTQTEIYVSPLINTATTCATMTFDVMVKNAVDLTAFHLEIDFDPGTVEVVEVVNGGFLITPGETTLFEPTNSWNNTTGKILWGMAQQGTNGDPLPKDVGPEGAKLITITLQAKTPGDLVPFTIDGTKSMLVNWPDVELVPFIVTGPGVVATSSCAPTDIILTPNTVEDGAAAGIEVGTLTSIDADSIYSWESWTYNLVTPGTGAYPDNEWFAITGDKISTRFEADYSTRTSYTVFVRSTDAGGKYFEQPITINVTDSVPPVIVEVTPPEGAILLSANETFILTVRAFDLNLFKLEVDHSMESDPTVPEFSLYASATNPYGSDAAAAAFAAAGVTVTYDDVEQVWTIDFGEEVTNKFIQHGGINFYLVLEDMAGNQWGSMYQPTEENIYRYTITRDSVFPTVLSGIANSASDGTVALADGKFTVNQGYVVDSIQITMAEPVLVELGTIVTMVGYGPYGTITANENGVVTITPYPGNEVAAMIGPFAFTVPDGSVTDLAGNIFTGSIALEVLNVAPVAVDDTYTVAEDGSLTVPARGVLTNDTDFDPSVLTAVLVIGPGNGTLTLNAAGSFTYTPNADFSGTDTFTYTAHDGLVGSNTATVTITISAFGDLPVLDSIGDQDATEGVELAFTVSGSDPDGGNLSFSLVGAPVGATIDPVSGEFLWTPTIEQAPGTYTFDVCVSDGVNTVCETITVTVAGADDAPVLDPIGDQDATEELELSFTVSGTDPEGKELEYSLVDAPVGAYIDPVTGAFSWTPTIEQAPGTYTFQICVSDGTTPVCEEITVTVAGVDDAPVLDPIGDQDATEEVELTFTVSGTDPEGKELEYSLVDAPTGATIDPVTGEFLWTPTIEQAPGTYTFQICVSDGTTPVCETITVTVAGADDAPVLDPIGNQDATEGVELVFTVSGTDPEGKDLEYSLVDAPTGATIDPVTGEFTWTPAEDQAPGTYTFDVCVSDGTTTVCETITVTVGEVGVAPVLNTIADATIPELVAFSFTATATDADVPAQVLTYSLVGAPADADITAAGLFTWMPSELQGPGVYPFTVKVCDDATPALCDEQAVTLTVAEVNVAPVLGTIANATIPELALFSFTATAADADVPAQVLTFSLVGAPTDAAINSAGGFTWTPTELHGAGVYTFIVKVCDNAMPALCDDQAVTLTVSEVNGAPVLNPIGDQDATEGEELVFIVIATDPEGGVLIYSLVDAPIGAMIDPVTGEFTWTPSEDQAPGTYTFDVCVSDGVNTTCETITIIVAAIPEPTQLKIYLPIIFR